MTVTRTRLALIAVGLCCLFGVSGGCTPGRSSMRRHESQKSTPLVYKQFVPNRAENSLAASGAAEGIIRRDSARFKELAENHNTDILFKDEEGTGADRLMSQRCRDKLTSLAVMVMNQWPGVRLRVTESWDEDAAHADDSLHYEGRAVDVTTSDKDKSKLGMLARLAYEAGFDWVYYESKNHIHCSVKSDKSQAVRTGGCFDGRATVQLESGETRTMSSLQLGDKVMAVDAAGKQFYDEVFSFLDAQRDSDELLYTIQTENNLAVAVTATHLLFTASGQTKAFNSSLSEVRALFAHDIKVGQFLYTISSDEAVMATQDGRSVRASMVPANVTSVTVHRTAGGGLYAPVTLGGTIVVDGVVASCYAVVNDHHIAHHSLAPLRFMHHFRRHLSQWLPWLVAPATAADRGRGSSGLHWYADLLLRTVHPLAGDLLFG